MDLLPFATLLYFIFWAVIIISFLCYVDVDNFEGDMGKFSLIVFLFWLISFDLDTNHSEPWNKTTTKHLVSSSPAETYIEGQFSLVLGTGSGSVGSNRWYILREKISDNLYKDFTVKKDVYLEERESLPKDEGLFTQDFECTNKHRTFRMLFWTLEENPKEDCKFIKQTIILPKGYIIKEIRGI